MHIERAVADWSLGARKDHRKGTLSTTILRYILRVLRGALKQAVLWRIIPYNPADSVKMPNRGTFEATVYSPEQAKKLVEVADADMRVPILFVAIPAYGEANSSHSVGVTSTSTRARLESIRP